jgi:putative ABC transport system permease protein
MIRKHILLAFRQMVKDKVATLLTMGGLAAGITTFTILFFYLHKERSYDRFHNQAENIYRVVQDIRVGSQHNSTAWTPGALVHNLQLGEIAEISQAVRLFRYRSTSEVIDKETSKSFSEENFIWADSNLFRIFSFDFLKGEPADVLIRPNTMIISESIARKYFGAVNPIGKVLTNLTFGADFEITGVIRDMPVNSHFKADLICALNTLPKLWGHQILTSWGNSFLYSYIKIEREATSSTVQDKLNALTDRHLIESNDASYDFSLQPLTDIHLYSHLQNEWTANSDIMYVYILTCVAILILLVSAVNYVNLWIARSENRMKEIGIRKAIGGSKTQLSFQFIIENLIHGILSFLISIGLVGLLLPWIGNFLEERLLIPTTVSLQIWLSTGGVVVSVMLLVTLYPVQTIAQTKPAVAIRGTIIKFRRGIGLWYGLISFQIIVSALLIAGSLLINRQLKFIYDKSVGYDADHLLNITLLTDESQRDYKTLKNEILRNTKIKSASACSHVLGGMLYQSGYTIYKTQGTEEVMWQRIHVDQDYCRTYGIEIVAGRDFSSSNAADTSSFIINEAAWRHLGFSSAEHVLGLEVGYDNGRRGKIIGVMKDFHFKTIHTPIEPLIIHIVPGRFRMLTINIDQAGLPRTLEWLKSKWSEFDPSTPFVYASLSDFNEKNYVFERKFSKLIMLFTLVASVLSALGLIGLNIYIINLKRKEIGIRKILGAGISDLLSGLSRPFVLISLVAFGLSVPLSWYTLSVWLSSFAYKVELSIGLFVLTGLIIFGLSIASIILPSFIAARSNPAKVLNEN